MICQAFCTQLGNHSSCGLNTLEPMLTGDCTLHMPVLCGLTQWSSLPVLVAISATCQKTLSQGTVSTTCQATNTQPAGCTDCTAHVQHLFQAPAMFDFLQASTMISQCRACRYRPPAKRCSVISLWRQAAKSGSAAWRKQY